MTITLKNGTDLLVKTDSRPTSYFYRLYAKKYSETNYLITDAVGFEKEIHKSLLIDNDIDIINGRIDISPYLYHNWFDEFYKSTIVDRITIYISFIKNIDLILKNRELVYSDSRLFFVKLPFAHGAANYGGSFYLTLGSLLEAWSETILDYKCPECGGEMKILGIAGSVLSGGNSTQGVCFNCKKVSNFTSGAFHTIFNRFKDLSMLYNVPTNAIIFSLDDAIAIMKYKGGS